MFNARKEVRQQKWRKLAEGKAYRAEECKPASQSRLWWFKTYNRRTGKMNISKQMPCYGSVWQVSLMAVRQDHGLRRYRGWGGSWRGLWFCFDRPHLVWISLQSEHFPKTFWSCWTGRFWPKIISFAYFSCNHGSQLCTDLQSETEGWSEATEVNTEKVGNGASAGLLRWDQSDQEALAQTRGRTGITWRFKRNNS